MKFELQWAVGHSMSPDVYPKELVKAAVPGNANRDWAIAKKMPDWNFGTNFEQYAWMEDCFWLYEAQIPPINMIPEEQLFFVTKGIDYEYVIYLDGKEVHRHEGMFSGVEILLPANGGELLQIWIAPVPKDRKAHGNTREEAAQCCKPAVSYGWDWHPRLIPMGIWDETYLETRKRSYLQTAFLEYELSADYSTAALDFKAQAAGPGEVTFVLYHPDGGKALGAKCGERARLNGPKLWWCNGYGEPNLYRWEAMLTLNGECIDKKAGTVGFRTIELTMNEGAWEEPEDFPKGRSPVPITITLNGVRVFAKGSNWVNPEIFTGTITPDTYRPLIKLAHKMNFNILRSWGGAIVNKESFFNLCDEYGLLVWQEFPLACNNYRATPHYLEILAQEARAIVTRLKHHACMAIWCGGNELFNNWSMMTDQSHALRLLNKICYELSPELPFIATSPLFGMAHGNYLFRYHNGKEVFAVMPEAHNTAYTEFGVPSIANRETCQSIARLSDLFPLRENAVTVAHHAFHAWNDSEPWACLATIEDYFGAPETLEQLIGNSQWLQGEGYKCIFEEARRQKPYCSMAINWCYNEPWPTLANNSLINYPAAPKASWASVAAACRPALVSARIPKFAWRGGEMFAADLWLLNDGNEEAGAGQAEIFLELCGEKYLLHQWRFGPTPANTNLEGPTVRIKLPILQAKAESGAAVLNQGLVRREKGKRHEMTLVLEAGPMSSVYRLLFNE